MQSCRVRRERGTAGSCRRSPAPARYRIRLRSQRARSKAAPLPTAGACAAETSSPLHARAPRRSDAPSFLHLLGIDPEEDVIEIGPSDAQCFHARTEFGLQRGDWAKILSRITEHYRIALL